ncbi:hypothetical protein HOLleu_07468 [Holothuria leucospilota]|uniref:Uncharacterized protein n=1 Tax=Holothuria leucospilota TaxID=206669 RepID=A0A9Q1CHN4_HOLLE|nr:hypothetical protein HOLleu_07468 [Holothuria leucospilota]
MKPKEKQNDDSVNVTSTLQHLQELGNRMKSTEFGFKETDIDAISLIAISLKELEDDRLKLHALLETETIHASLLRHKLQFFPDEIEKEILEALQSARHSNAEELKSLQEKLNELNTEIDSQEEKQRQLSKENAVLHPERDMVRRQHEEVIAQLNQRMADKAGKQITLNETRDKLRETNQQIIDLETGIVILKEDMIQERADARQEKKRLKQAVHETTKKIKRQKEANLAKKKQVDTLQEEVMESENVLLEIKRSVKRYDSSKARMEAQKKSLLDQLENENKENEILKEKGMELESIFVKLERQYAEVKDEMEKNLEQLDVEIAETKETYEKLEENWTKMKVAIHEADGIRAKDEAIVKELDDVLQGKKSELTQKADETAMMKIENDQMERQMKQLEENHLVTVQLGEKQIADLQLALSKERKERFDLQEQRDGIGREMEDFRQAFAQHMSDMNDRIMKAKKDHADLTAEGLQLTKDIETADKTINSLKKDSNKVEKKFNKMKKELGDSLHKLENEIADLEESVASKQKDIDAKLPAFEELEKFFEEKTKEYELKKKQIVELKNQRSTLEDSNVKVKREIQRLSTPKVAMRQELRQKRTRAISKMKEQQKQLAELEEKIYHAGRKLKAVIEENSRFDEALFKLREELDATKRSIVLNKVLQENLKRELNDQRGKLQFGWGKDRQLQDDFAKRDQVFLDNITDLCRRTDKREQKISDITESLHRELVVLAGFLENVASRRPTDTRQGNRSRPSTEHRPPTVLRNYLDSRTQIQTRSTAKPPPTASTK